VFGQERDRAELYDRTVIILSQEQLRNVSWQAIFDERIRNVLLKYSETCEIRTPLGRAISVPNSEVSSFHRAICTENSNLGPDEVSLFHRMSSFHRVAIHTFHCINFFF
jgi:hypothetical protein